MYQGPTGGHPTHRPPNRAAGGSNALLGRTLPRHAKKLDVEANLADRLHLVVDLRLYNTVLLRGEDVLFERWFQDPVAKLALGHADATPDAPLRGMPGLEGGRNRRLRELRGPAIGNDVRGDGLQTRISARAA